MGVDPLIRTEREGKQTERDSRPDQGGGKIVQEREKGEIEKENVRYREKGKRARGEREEKEKW